MKKIVCVVVGTNGYLSAIAPCVRRVRAAVYHAKRRREIEFQLVVVTDHHGEATVREVAPEADVRIVETAEGGVPYKEQAQILIANLQQVGFAAAIEHGADLCWSVESDVLVPHNALSCMMDMLEFDDGYYDVAFVTYPSQSGGCFLGGNGSPTHPIEEDFLPEERELSPELAERLESAKKGEGDLAKVMEEVKGCPPKGNVFELNAKGWRRRGWLDHAHPGIGRGAVIQTDWTGLGCNLLSARALASAAFDGYDGRGTQDLFLNWRRWHADGLRMCCITHIVCEHVVKANDGQRRVHAFAHHEPLGECKGHLRVEHRPFYRFDGKDEWDQSNTGKILPRDPVST